MTLAFYKKVDDLPVKRTHFRNSMKEQVIEMRHRSDCSTKKDFNSQGSVPFLSCITVLCWGLFLLPYFLWDYLHVHLQNFCACFIFKFLPSAALNFLTWFIYLLNKGRDGFFSFLFLRFISLVTAVLFAISLNIA